AYTHYLQCQSLAESLGEREAAWQHAQTTHTEQQKIHEECILQLAQANAAYNPEQHQIVQRQLDNDKMQYHVAQGQVEEKERQRAVNEGEYQELVAKQEEQRVLQTKARELGERVEATEFVRGV